jgi:threonine aldolase
MTVDLRSDTVTKPDPAMRQAMAEAEVGDDVYGEDPTVNALQQEAAALLGSEAALFMPSGTMTNQVALAVHLRRGEEVICPEGVHIYEWELGMMAAFSGAVPRFVPAPLGIPDLEELRAAIHRSPHQSPSGLISLENTHNKAGGTVIPLATCQAVQQLAREEGLPVHLDGARIFNAAVALGQPVSELARGFDSVSLCLSKGLGAPVGSLLLGSAAFIAQAHRYRKMLGGGMRQAGVLAAAGLLALRQGPSRLAADHARARRLAEGLAGAGYALDRRRVQTNMVYFGVPQAASWVRRAAERGVLVSAVGTAQVRAVLHHQISDAHLELALRVFSELRP